MSIVDLFKRECSFMRDEHNGSDCLVYPKISEKDRAATRSNFGISKDETILLIRDTGFWNSRDQGLVVTDAGFYCIVDNDKPELFNFGWESFTDITYQELCLYFKNQGDEVPLHMSYFIKNSDENHMARIGRLLARVFKKMSESVITTTSDIFEAIDEKHKKLIQQKNYPEALELCDECIKNHKEYQFIFHSWMADIYGYMKNWQKSIEYSLIAIKECEVESISHSIIYPQYSLYCAYHELGNNNKARKDCLNVMLNATDQTDDNNLLIKDKAVKDFQLYEKKYIDNFLSFPYNDRKVIMPIKKYVDLHQEHVAVLNIQNLPLINFPMGHPIANQLYVGHPLTPAKYIPFENYQLELVEDRIREFCMLAQSLGATEISIECLNSTNSNQNNKIKVNNSGSVETLWVDGKTNQHIERSRHMIDELSRSVSLRQTFEPRNKPTIPEGMVWYDNEPSWQRLVSQRLSGCLTSHEERIETKKSQMLEGQELSAIKTEVKSLYADMDITIDKTEESKYAQQENAVLAIKVKFAPISQLLDNANKSQTPSSNETTEEEDEYITELKEILTDGDITPRERRLLDKIRIQFGISEQRAKELEESLTTLQLTEEEQEYLNEYKEIIVGREITEKERRLLDKILKLNGISQDRAREIEASVK